MTPKEKAEGLTHNFYEIENDSQYFGVNWEIAKQCALIAVEEILKAIPNEYLDVWQEANMVINEDIEYWQEVKTEIQNL